MRNNPPGLSRPRAFSRIPSLPALCLGMLFPALVSAPALGDGIPKACFDAKEYTLVKSTFKRKQLVLRGIQVQGQALDTLPAGFISVQGVGAIELRNLDTLRLESEEADSLETRVRAFDARSVRQESAVIHFEAAP